MMESIAQQAAKDARDVFSDDRQAQTAISYMEQLVYAALRNVEYDLTDPVTVHANMLRGTIAKPTVEQIIHLYGVDALTKALAPVIVREAVPDALHRSFPEAGDGRPMPPMGDELMTAGLSAEDARFVAVQLAQNGWMLTPNPVDARQMPDLAVNALDPAAIREAALKEAAAVAEACERQNYARFTDSEHHSHYRAGLQSAGQAIAAGILALIPKAPTEYERKVAQMKEDFPNGI